MIYNIIVNKKKNLIKLNNKNIQINRNYKMNNLKIVILVINKI